MFSKSNFKISTSIAIVAVLVGGISLFPQQAFSQQKSAILIAQTAKTPNLKAEIEVKDIKSLED